MNGNPLLQYEHSGVQQAIPGGKQAD